jgi:hypothetical protein
MTIIDRDLVRAINKGTCFILVGSGASCEIGLPNWQQLIVQTHDHFVSKLNISQSEKIKKIIKQNEFPKAFSELSKHIEIQEIVNFIKPLLEVKNKSGKIYNLLMEWPFRCYLTTNFDDALDIYSKTKGLTLLKKGNSLEDFKYIRADSKDLIFKIHGDTSDCDNIVLTEEQFEHFRKSKDKEYWREKILSLLHMVDLVILGYSVNDPDFNDQLERAKNIVTPDKPVFLFATGISPEQMREYYVKYNIRVISYKNESGRHIELLKMLNRYNPFIAKRGGGNIGLTEINEVEATKAASMYLFTQLRLTDESENYIAKIYASFIFQLLQNKFRNLTININELKDAVEKEKYFSSKVDVFAFANAVEYLHNSGYIDVKEHKINLTELGNQTIDRLALDRNLLRDKFVKSCHVFLENNFPNLDDSRYEIIIKNLREGLIRAFEKRGLEIAQAVYQNKQLELSDNIDILDIVNESGKSLEQLERAAHADLMMEILLSPNSITKEYLAALTQGYFSYHALGLDPTCYNNRLELARKNKWIIDASILLPLLAIDCGSQEYALDLLQRLQAAGLNCITTESLLFEIVEHASWAFKNITRLEKSQLEMLHAATGSPGYKQNLFIAGYIKWLQKQGNPNFQKYMDSCIGVKKGANLYERTYSELQKRGIQIIDFDKLPGLTQEEIERKELLTKEIEILRKKNSTFRSYEQCKAEAEVILINERDHSNFISQSIHLNKISVGKGLITWTPDATYRFLILLSKSTPSKELLYQCMTQDFFFSGFTIVDKEAMAKFISPLIKQGRMELKQEVQVYEEALGTKRYKEILENYEKQPDEMKPFYSVQIAFYLARKGIIESKILKDQVTKIDKSIKLSEKERQEFNRLKAKADEKKRKQQKNERAVLSGKGKKHKKKKK